MSIIEYLKNIKDIDNKMIHIFYDGTEYNYDNWKNIGEYFLDRTEITEHLTLNNRVILVVEKMREWIIPIIHFRKSQRYHGLIQYEVIKIIRICNKYHTYDISVDGHDDTFNPDVYDDITQRIRLRPRTEYTDAMIASKNRHNKSESYIYLCDNRLVLREDFEERARAFYNEVLIALSNSTEIKDLDIDFE